MTSSMCWPHPRQVVFPQRAQRAGEHMLFPSIRVNVGAVGKVGRVLFRLEFQASALVRLIFDIEFSGVGQAMSARPSKGNASLTVGSQARLTAVNCSATFSQSRSESIIFNCIPS
jgi:hypothetical protein